MVVLKVLEGTLAVGATSITFTDSDIPNSIIGLSATKDGLYPSEQTVSGNVLTITYEAQTSAVGIAVYLIKNGLQVIDSLDSTDTGNALSANQGKALKDLIDALSVPDLSDLPDVDISSLTDGQFLMYDDTAGKWVNATPELVTSLEELTDVDITTPASGDVLMYDGTEWINSTVSSGGLNYSTTEQAIGTWMNKTLYSKIVDLGANVNISNNNWYANITTISDIDFIVSCFGIYSTGSFYPLMAYHSEDNINVLACRYSGDASIRYLVLQYTKTEVI